MVIGTSVVSTWHIDQFTTKTISFQKYPVHNRGCEIILKYMMLLQTLLDCNPAMQSFQSFSCTSFHCKLYEIVFSTVHSFKFYLWMIRLRFILMVILKLIHCTFFPMQDFFDVGSLVLDKDRKETWHTIQQVTRQPWPETSFWLSKFTDWNNSLRAAWKMCPTEPTTWFTIWSEQLHHHCGWTGLMKTCIHYQSLNMLLVSVAKICPSVLAGCVGSSNL